MSKRTHKFKTEVQQLLDLVIHSLYSKKEIFLRELISNASDAIDRLRFEGLTDKALLDEGEDWRIRLSVDRKARTVTISDNGVGMNSDELDSHLGTIANSGTRNFLRAIQEAKGAANTEFIGQFGVGFYSSFMVAEGVTVVTRRAGKDQTAYRWTSAGDGAYAIEETEKAGRGTEVTLHLREGMDEFLDGWRLRELVKHYSDYIAYPIVLAGEPKAAKEGEKEPEAPADETINSMKSIWKRAKSDVTAEEYNEFYRHISHDSSEPLRVIHYAGEGTTEFRALLFLPSHAPSEMFFRDRMKGVHLYVRNVFITDDCRELLPDYLRFVRGAVDSSDLPLNVSREILQDDAIIRRIRKSLVGRILSDLKDLKDSAADDYRKFHGEFGRALKEGMCTDYENQDKLKDLIMFMSTRSDEGKPVFLRDYVDRMGSGQKDIYYLPAENLSAASHSPLLEAFRRRGFEVLFFTEAVDEWLTQSLREYDGKKLVPIDRGAVDLEEGESAKEEQKKRKQAEAGLEGLLKAVAAKLGDEIKEARISTRLTDSAACLVADEHGLPPHMERMMRAMNQTVPKMPRILELNAEHPVVARLKAIFDANAEDSRIGDFAELLHAQALVAEGSPLKDPGRFTKLVSDLMVKGG